jgi:hypothetical protein
MPPLKRNLSSPRGGAEGVEQGGGVEPQMHSKVTLVAAPTDFSPVMDNIDADHNDAQCYIESALR